MVNKKLEAYFSAIKNSNIYTSFYDGIHDYRDAPILYKDKLRELLDRNFDIQKEEKGVYLVRSGGSTQKPLVFPVDIKENLEQRELLAQQLIKKGILPPKTIALNLFSYRDMYRTAAILDDVLERAEATTLALSSSANFELIHHTITQYKPTIILGTPSKLTLFANYLLENKKSITIKNVLFGGEYLQPSQQKLFSTVFNTEHIYSLYGSAETGIWAWADYSEKEIEFHFLKALCVEISTPDENGFGAVIVSNTLRKRFPVFRYNMGDIGKLITKKGQSLLLLKSREAKSFSLHSDSYFLTDFDEVLKQIDSYQVQLSLNSAIQTKIQFLLIKRQVEQKNNTATLEHIQQQISEILNSTTAHTQLEVRFASEDELYINKTTSKTPKVIDFRS